ncbi:MAG TPA: hypothetical protein VGM96_03580 [Reyranella sp.]|jgi:hypothetical protein
MLGMMHEKPTPLEYLLPAALLGAVVMLNLWYAVGWIAVPP